MRWLQNVLHKHFLFMTHVGLHMLKSESSNDWQNKYSSIKSWLIYKNWSTNPCHISHKNTTAIHLCCYCLNNWHCSILNTAAWLSCCGYCLFCLCGSLRRNRDRISFNCLGICWWWKIRRYNWSWRMILWESCSTWIRSCFLVQCRCGSRYYVWRRIPFWTLWWSIRIFKNCLRERNYLN